MERGKYLTRDEIDKVCKSYCRGHQITFYCTDCPILREGRRDRTEYFRKYYQEKTKKKRQEARQNDTKELESDR